MQDQPEHWRILCAQAAQEPNPERLTQLIQEMCDLLDQRDHQLQARMRAGTPEPLARITAS